jgi:hypothetical protein
LSNPRQALQTELIQTNKNACDEMASAFYAEAGRRVAWKVLINEPGLIGSIRIHPRTYGDKVPSIVAVPNVSDSPIAERIELLEPQLLMLGDQALILRSYEGDIVFDAGDFDKACIIPCNRKRPVHMFQR